MRNFIGILLIIWTLSTIFYGIICSSEEGKLYFNPSLFFICYGCGFSLSLGLSLIGVCI